MAQISDPGRRFGELFGAGISSGIQKLAENKLEQVNRQNFQNRWSGKGLKPEQVDLLYETQKNPAIGSGVSKLFETFGSMNGGVEDKQQTEMESLKKLFGDKAEHIYNLPADLRKEIIKSELRPPTLWESLSNAWSGSPSRGIYQNMPQADNVPQAEENQQAPQKDDLLKYLASQGIKGGIGGVTGLGALPFNAANFVSGGKIPVPEAIKSLQAIPENVAEGLLGKQEAATPEQEALGGAVETIASLLTPGGLLKGLGKGAQILGKSPQIIDTLSKALGIAPKAAAKIAVAGEGAKWLAKKAGARKGIQEAAKMGGMLLVPAIGTRRTAATINQLENNISTAAQEAGSIKSPDLYSEMGKFYNKISKTAETPLKKQILEEIIAPMNSVNFKVSDLVNLKQNLDKAAQVPEFATSLRNSLPVFQKELDAVLKKAPKVGSMLSEVEDLKNALQTTSRIHDWVNKNLFKRASNPLAAGLFGITGSTLGLTKPKAVLGGLAALPAGEIERLIRMSYKSPAFRKIYGDTVNAALVGNVREFNKEYDRLNRVIEKESKK